MDRAGLALVIASMAGVWLSRGLMTTVIVLLTGAAGWMLLGVWLLAAIGMVCAILVSLAGLLAGRRGR